jgi:predicted ATPase
MKVINSNHYLLSVALQRQRLNSKWNEYPFRLPVVRGLKTLDFHPKVTFIVGENGSGKSTLLEALAIGMGFNPEGGSRNFNFSTNDTHSNLHDYLTFQKGIKKPQDGYFLRAESFYNVATEIDRLYSEESTRRGYGGTSLHEQSHGEALLSLIGHRFGDKGLYMLDEPEAALSPTRQLTMLAHMHRLIASGSQFIIATHSPILLGYPDATILSIEADGLRPVAYEDTAHVQIMRHFLLNRESILYELLKSE